MSTSFLAAKEANVADDKSGVLGAEGEKGSEPSLPECDKGGGAKFNLGASLREQDHLKVISR